MIRNRLLATAAVIRTWNNKFIAKQVQNLLAMGVGKVIIVINATPDKGATRGYLGQHLTHSKVQLIEMYEGYTWSNALNRALMAIQMANVTQRKNFDFLFNVSVEAQFKYEHFVSMLDVMADDKSVGIVGTSFEGRQDGNVVALGQSYKHPRNTGMFIRLEAIGSLFGGFDPYCDDIGGMEDIDFTLRMLALSDLTVEHLDLKVPLIVGNNYHQSTKEKNERQAMDKIIARWRAYFPPNTKERVRIEDCIGSMGIDPVAPGDFVTWTKKAIYNSYDDRYDAALVAENDKLEVLSIDATGSIIVKSQKRNATFPANPSCLRRIWDDKS